MHTLFFRRLTIGLALLVVLAFSFTRTSVTHLAVHATSVTARITLSNVTGPPTTTLTVDGTGFGSKAIVFATFDHTKILGTITTSSTGSFSLGITIPAAALPGQHSIQATGKSSGLTASQTFLVNTNWQQFGYDPAHSRTNPYENVLTRTNVSNLTLDWSFTTVYPIFSSPSVVNGVVYFIANGYMYALNAKTGIKVWSYYTASPNSSPAVANGVVYIGSNNRNIYGLDASTGAMLWSYTTHLEVQSSPAVANGVVYVGSGDSTIYAFHLPGM